MLDLKPGDILPNGATLLLSHPLPATPSEYPGAVVLAYEPGGKEFVTWLYLAPPAPREAFCTIGVYRDDVVDAIGDYLERCGDKRGALLKELQPDSVVLDPATAHEYEMVFDASSPA